MPVVTSQGARFFHRSRSMWSRSSLNSAGVRKTVSSTRVCGRRRPTQGFVAITPARTAPLNAPERNPCLLAMVLPLPSSWDPAGNRGLGDRGDGEGAEDGVDVAPDVGPVASDGGRLDAGEVVDVGVEPLGDGRDVLADLVELDDAEGLVGPVVLQQGLESLGRGQVFEGE
jgi:hypothetical protein